MNFIVHFFVRQSSIKKVNAIHRRMRVVQCRKQMIRSVIEAEERKKKEAEEKSAKDFFETFSKLSKHQKEHFMNLHAKKASASD